MRIRFDLTRETGKWLDIPPAGWYDNKKIESLG